MKTDLDPQITLDHNRNMMANFEKGDGNQIHPFKAVIIFGATYDDNDEVTIGWTVDQKLPHSALIATLEAIVAQLKKQEANP